MKRSLFLLLLAGCAAGPDYHAPKPATPAAWDAGTNTAATVVEWWKTFHDAELDSLITRAVKANHDLRRAEARLAEARALRNGAYWDLGPAVTGAGAWTDKRTSKNARPAAGADLHTVTYDAHFDARWELDVFGGKRRAVEAALAAFRSIEEDRRDVWISVIAEVARNYLDVRGAQQRHVIAQKNIAAQTEAVAIARARFNGGLTSELDVKQAETLLATTQAQVPAIETTRQQATYRLGVLLGQLPESLVAELAATAPLPPVPPTVPVGLPSELLRRRPDVRRAERDLAAATANIGIETAELFPKFSLLGTGGLQSFSAGDWFTYGSRYWSAGPTVTWRVFDFGRIRAQVKAATARQEQALVGYEQTVLGAFADVEGALAAYANERARRQALTEAVASSRRAVELANELYTKGLGNFLNVLDAQRSLFQLEDQLVESDRAVTVNLVALYKALGGGWELAEPVALR